jgi:hypothetical protein
MFARTLGVRGRPTGSPGLWGGRDMDNHVSLRPADPLARELVRYAVVGGLASLVDVGLLVGLTSGGGVYYLHAAAIAFAQFIAVCRAPKLAGILSISSLFRRQSREK